ncbi:uncharacterized protein YALI1_B12313g [Yarrowia lipolytica]|uniref:Uncharacterized protein n=1 Tax=Yarrowia lipolytica TaxID=4952 RepID=A0A1D8N732_YARLL|nr:hypothetical protein YALI1_B12313g [Yarrowia lipolytica]
MLTSLGYFGKNQFGKFSTKIQYNRMSKEPSYNIELRCIASTSYEVASHFSLAVLFPSSYPFCGQCIAVQCWPFSHSLFSVLYAFHSFILVHS